MARLKAVILILLCQLVVQACRSTPTVNSELENVDSMLLDVMMQKSDFVEKTSWGAELIKQANEIPAEQNKWLAEIASHGLSGEYNGSYYIVVDNKLKRYIRPVEWSEPLSSTAELDEEEISVFLSKAGNSMKSQCFKSKVATRCEIIVQYEQLISYLWIYGPNNLAAEDLSSILDPIILGIDGRIK